MRSPTPVPHARILGVGDYRPARSVSNDELSQTLDTSDGWIRERTGIATRGVAGPDEEITDMAVAAAAKALAASGVPADEIDLVLVTTFTQRWSIPIAAGVVASRLGLTAGAYDLNAACAGFCYGLSTAADAVRAGSARYVLLVGSERTSDLCAPDDRGTRIIFGDGAGAVLVGPSSRPGIGPVAWGSDGSQAHLIAQTDEDPFMRMQGQPVFRWATTKLAPVARRACELADVKPTELAAFVPHQANLRIITALTRALGAPGAVVADDIVTSGNTSAASVPMALARLLEQGRVQSGDLALLFAFGGGLSFAGQVVTIP